MNGSSEEYFYEWLEYHLTKTFKSSTDPDLIWFWCDGILKPSGQTSTSDKVIITEAFVGLTGQDKYEMTIRLGPNASEDHKNGSSLINCVPESESFDWVLIDVENRMIELQLN